MPSPDTKGRNGSGVAVRGVVTSGSVDMLYGCFKQSELHRQVGGGWWIINSISPCPLVVYHVWVYKVLVGQD